MLNLKTIILLGGISAVIALTGCKSESSSNQSDGRSAGRTTDDNNITSTVQNGLNQEPAYKFNDVTVKTYAGVVQLSGFVTTDGQKQRAGEIAQQVSGVAQVINNINLKPTANLAPTGEQNK
jgi:hyperosmotically inducible protein